LNSHETLCAKNFFEDECGKHGVIPQSYITDQGRSFTSVQFEEHLNKFKQTVSQAAPGGYHANGTAERNVGTVMSIT